ncbi:MAG: PRC-barrel domain-containing protein [Nitrospiraceae bacterium]
MKQLLIVMLLVGVPLVSLGASIAEMTKPGQTAMVAKVEIPKSYLILPVPRGELRDVPRGNTLLDAAVIDSEGKNIGIVDKLIMDTRTEKIVYAVIELSDTGYRVPVPWKSLKVNRADGKIWLNGKEDDLRPYINLAFMKDHSPSMAQLMEEVNEVRTSTPADRSGLGVTKQPAAAGPSGEEMTGGAGPSGPRGMPVGK